MKQLFTILLIFVYLAIEVNGQTILTQWNFNASNATPSTGVGTLSLVGGTSVTYASGAGSSDPTTPGSAYNTTTYPATGTNNKTAGVQFNINTTGYFGITVSWDQRHSNTAANTIRLQYTLDNTAGTPTWVDAEQFTFTPAATGTGDTWYNNRSGNFSAINGCDNNPNFAFRVVSEFDPVANNYLASRSTSTYGTTGTLRFDMVTVRYTSTTLPIQLSSFEATNRRTSTLLSFTTATEKNNAYFAIERSSDGRTFTSIGEVKCAGTSLTQQDYTYTDEKPLRGTNFYRLKQVDFDGQFSYSPVVSVVFGKVGNVVLYPTPTTSTMNVRLEEAFQTEANWQVIDLVGRVVTEGIFPAEQTEMQIPVGTLSEGNYVLRVTAGQEVITQKFRKIEK